MISCPAPNAAGLRVRLDLLHELGVKLPPLLFEGVEGAEDVGRVHADFICF